MESQEEVIKQPLAHWVLSDRVNIPDFHLANWTLPDGTIEPQIPNTLLPGSERWAGFGLEYGMLSFKNARELITPYEFAQEFKNLRNCKIMDKIWEQVTDLNTNNEMLITSNNTKTTKLVVWAPGHMFADPIKSIYFVYHPLILETKNKKLNGLNSWLLVGYNKDHGTGDINRDWTSLPTIDFLPCDKSMYNRKIIAGSAGLLVIAGGQHGYCQNLHLSGVENVPNENFWKHSDVYVDYQSLVFVANPLTKEYIILPPLPGRLMNKKIGKFIWRNKERTSYMLILIGWDVEVERASQLKKFEKTTKYSNLDKKNILRETLGLFVYSSQEKCYIYSNEIESRSILLNFIKKSYMAMVGYKIFVGGMMTLYNAKSIKVESPCLYYFNMSNSTCIKKLIIPFVLKAIPNSTSFQAPKLVQGNSTRIFAIACARIGPITLYIVEVIIKEHKQDFWEFKLVATMPKAFFQKLFSKSTCIDNYEVTGCNSVISFKAGGKATAVIQYHIKNSQWSSTYFPKLKHSNAASYHLIDAVYEPCFHARP